MEHRHIGPVLPCGHFHPKPDCEWLRRTLVRSPRQRGVPCMWMVKHGFLRSAESLADAEAKVQHAVGTR